MKTYYITFLMIFIVADTNAQRLQMINYEERSAQTRSAFYYWSIPDSVCFTVVKNELQLLSDFFFKSPAYWYFDSLEVLPKEMSQSNVDIGSIFLDLNSLKEPGETTIDHVNMVNKLAHEYVELIVLKYNLSLTTEEEIIFTDYLSGYYLSSRFRNAVKNKEKCVWLTTYFDTNYTAVNCNLPASSKLAMIKGADDFLSNYRKRQPFTLHDIIRAGLNVTTTIDTQ
ncbi:hypothetical protein NPE20_18100 [Mucilaginibacter sp. JC4]|uniref:Uncharacterized protein n=2 Tax=Mucilaginibacter aquariorum TaxID=2967225 RepID=A0ABT1T5I8_9SPHI|nr:hypothetical protein [Mucilaginibacter aquariorum]